MDRRVLYSTHFPLMGGSGAVRFVDDRGRERAERIARAVENEARRIEVKCSRYRESSVISEVNRNAGHTPVAVDAETEQLVLLALDLARITHGRFDPTLGAWAVGRPWAIGVVDPEKPHRCRFAVRTVGSSGVATSGNYERAFVKDGVRYHHILDATTGWPARGLASVTVVAGSTFRAGQLATAAFLLGPEAGRTLIEETEGVDGALITEEGAILATSGMAALSDLPGGLYATLPSL